MSWSSFLALRPSLAIEADHGEAARGGVHTVSGVDAAAYWVTAGASV
jgi:hypothetical protein